MYKLIYILILLLTTTIFAKSSTIGIVNIKSDKTYNFYKDNTILLEKKLGMKLSTVLINKDIPKNRRNNYLIKLGKKYNLNFIIYTNIQKSNNIYTLKANFIDVSKKELTTTEILFKNENNYSNVLDKLTNKIFIKIDLNKGKIKNKEKIIANLMKSVKNFVDNLPILEGVIRSLPKAGTLGIKITKGKRFISGLKLMSKQQEIEGLTNGGVFYIRNKNGRIEAKYFRNEVGKFEIGDKFSSQWYTPIFVIGKIVDKENNREIGNKMKLKIKNSLNELENIKVVSHFKIDQLTNKLTEFNKLKTLRKLYGIGIDYTITGVIENNDIIFKIYSNYSGKILKIITVR